jgi:hypothetical protein
MLPIDYAAPAEVYASRHRGAKKNLFYRRFASVAEALQFAVESLPPEMTNVLLETDEERYEGATVRALYDAAEYPLARLAPAGKGGPP